jgi:hypothetical protein
VTEAHKLSHSAITPFGAGTMCTALINHTPDASFSVTRPVASVRADGFIEAGSSATGCCCNSRCARISGVMGSEGMATTSAPARG